MERLFEGFNQDILVVALFYYKEQNCNNAKLVQESQSNAPDLIWKFVCVPYLSKYLIYETFIRIAQMEQA